MLDRENHQAEYQNLEYEYRFLQWQINPHFIYNALETVNALAKMDGNDELCDMIMLLSAYFRRNAETMRKRFAPVREEFPAGVSSGFSGSGCTGTESGSAAELWTETVPESLERSFES